MLFRWADQCRGGHDSNRLVPSFRFFPYVGQNVYMDGNSRREDVDFDIVVQRWYDEVSRMQEIIRQHIQNTYTVRVTYIEYLLRRS